MVLCFLQVQWIGNCWIQCHQPGTHACTVIGIYSLILILGYSFVIKFNYLGRPSVPKSGWIFPFGLACVEQYSLETFHFLYSDVNPFLCYLALCSTFNNFFAQQFVYLVIKTKTALFVKKHIADFQCAMFEATSTLQINSRIKNGRYLCSMMKIFYFQLQDIQILPRSREGQQNVIMFQFI